MKHSILMFSGDVYELNTHEYLSLSYLFLSLEVLQLCFISAGNSRGDGVGSYSTSYVVDSRGFCSFFPISYFLVLVRRI